VHAKSHEALYVVEGSFSLVLGDEHFLLSPGDYVNIPAGTKHGFRYMSHRGKLISWTFDGHANDIYAALGEPFKGTVFRETDEQVDWAGAGDAADTTFIPHSSSGAREYSEPCRTAPEGPVPFVLASSEGERMIAADQLYTLMGNQSHSNGVFISIMNDGLAGPPIPRHFHERVSETFYVLTGALEMFVDGEMTTLYPGDFLHIPPRAVHAFQIVGHNTRFLGFITPGLFEPFFRYLCEPFEGYVCPIPPPPFKFDRVLQHLGELDLRLVGGKPPGV